MRAWITSTSSSRSSKMASQYSSKAGWHSGDRYPASVAGMPGSLRAGGRRGRICRCRRLQSPRWPGGPDTTDRSRSPVSPSPSGRGSPPSFREPTAAQAGAWPAIAGGRPHAVLRPHRLGQDVGRVPVGHRPAGDRDPPPEQGVARGCSTCRRCGPWPSTSRRTSAARCRASAWPPSGSASTFTQPTVGLRTGDTTADERRRAGPPPARHPHHHARVALPHAHVARPARRCAGSSAVIVDEIHALAATKRGAHLALVERSSGSTRRSCRPGRAGSASGCPPRSARSTRSPASSAATSDVRPR